MREGKNEDIKNGQNNENIIETHLERKDLLSQSLRYAVSQK